MDTEEKTGYPAVRELTRRDRKKLSELVRAFAERSGNVKLTEMLPGRSDAKSEETETDTDQTYELIKSILQGLIEWVEEEVTEWFMDLVGVTERDEYDRLPFDIEVHIIDELIAQQGFNNFFSRASELYKKIRG